MKSKEAEMTVRWYLEIEQRLRDLLRMVSPGDHDSDMVFPQLTNLIVDGGSLVDTVFREEFDPLPPKKQKNDLTIEDFAPLYEARLQFSAVKSVLYQYPLSYIQPYKGWIDPKKNQYARGSLPWWDSYNKLKHQRIQEYQRSTLRTAISTVGALFQQLATMSTFFDALLRHDMVDLNGLRADGPLHRLMDEIAKGKTPHCVLIESELFAAVRGCIKFPDDIDNLNPETYGGKWLAKYAGRYHI